MGKMRTLVAASLFVFALGAGSSETNEAFQKHFSGMLDARIPISMDLRRSGDALAGFYRYEKIGMPIPVSGTVKGALFSLSEYGDMAGIELSGEMELHVSGNASAMVLSGTWRTPDGTKSLSVKFDEDNSVALGFEAVSCSETKSFQEGNENAPVAEYIADSVIPTVSADRAAFSARFFGSVEPSEYFGQTAKAFFRMWGGEISSIIGEGLDAGDSASFSWTSYRSVRPVLNGRRYVVLLDEGYDFTGGAHGMPFLGYHTYDRSMRKFLSYADFFAPGSEKAIAELLTASCRKSLGLKPGESLEGGLFFVSDLPFTDTTSFYLCKGGLVVTYQAYEVAAYAAGLPRVTVPLKDVMPYLRAERKAFE